MSSNMNEEFTIFFSFIIFIILLILFLYFAYKQIKHFFKIEDFIDENKKEENKKNDENNKKEDFINIFSLSDFLFDIDEDGNFIDNKNTNKIDDKNDILEKVVHKKNLETKEREENNDFKNNIKQNDIKEIINDDIITYIVDKNSTKKDIHFSILNEKKLKYLTCKGFYDEHITININDIKNKEITKIINKIYNKYTFVYQTKDDNDAIHYFIEYRPSQERFIKLYNQNEDKVFYLEKIFYKEDKKNINLVPLYNIYHYANQIGTIYSNLGEDKVYQIRLNKEISVSENNKNIISFSFILYLSLLKEDF